MNHAPCQEPLQSVVSALPRLESRSSLLASDEGVGPRLAVPAGEASTVVARSISTLAALMVMLGIVHAAAADPPPCPPFVELPCDDAGEGGGAVVPPTFVCTPGEGGWARSPIELVASPQPRSDENTEFTMGFTRWQRHLWAEGSQNLATCGAILSGQSIFLGTGSQSAAITAMYQMRRREFWDGVGPAMPRVVTLGATGFAGMSIAVTCSPQAGCVASAVATATGGCSSLGEASAVLEPRAISATAHYDSAASQLQFSGNIGAAIDDSGPSITGEISGSSQWSTQGEGAASGAASYAVRPDRTYCAFTNRPYTMRSFAATSTSIAATVNAGSAAASAVAVAGFDVN